MPRPVEPGGVDDGLADAAAVARVLAGDVQAFAPLVARYQAALYRYAVSLVLDHEVAADMVQDAFVRAYTNLRSCRDHARFRAWLYQTLRHRCLDHLKERRRRDVPLDQAGPVPDPADDPGTLVERQGVRAEIARALATLPDAQREAFVLHYVEGLPYDTMAQVMEVSVSALKMRVLRARDTLATALRHRDVTKPAAVRLSFGRR